MNKLYVLLFAALSPLMVSCVDSIVFDTREERKPVVHCVLINDSTQTMELFWSKMMGESECLPITEADAYILRMGDYGEILDTSCRFQHFGGRTYKSSFFPTRRQKYQLIVVLPGGDTLRAQTTMPDDYILHVREISRNDAKVKSSYSYCILARRPGIPPLYKYIDPLEASYVWIQGRTTHGRLYPETHTFLYWWEDTTGQFADHLATDHLNVDDFNVTGKVVSDLKCLYDLEWYPEWDDWRLVLCPDLPLHKKILRIVHPVNYSNGLTDEELKSSPFVSTSDFTLSVELDETRVNGGHLSVPVMGNFVSYEYDRYLKNVYTRHFNEDNFVVSVYDTDNIYSNISGGVGIFGANHIYPETAIKIANLK